MVQHWTGFAEAAAPLLSPKRARSDTMRALTVLLALVATPLLAGVAQRAQALKSDNQHRAAQGTANAYKGACKPQDPLPKPPGLDADQDGGPGSLDTGPRTPPGTPGDAAGCPVQASPPPG